MQAFGSDPDCTDVTLHVHDEEGIKMLGPRPPRISSVKLAGLFLFLAGAILVVVGFAIGWVDGSLGYTDMMIFALGLMLGGILLWRP